MCEHAFRLASAYAGVHQSVLYKQKSFILGIHKNICTPYMRRVNTKLHRLMAMVRESDLEL